MKVLTLISDWFAKTSRNFTLLMLALMPIAALLFKDTNKPGLSFEHILFILVFSAASGASAVLSQNIKANAVIKEAVKFVIDCAAFVLIFVFGVGKTYLATSSSNAVRSVAYFVFAFTVLYLIVALAALSYRTVASKLTKKQPVYEKKFEVLKSDNDCK